jgi:hypothetical protein
MKKTALTFIIILLFACSAFAGIIVPSGGETNHVLVYKGKDADGNMIFGWLNEGGIGNVFIGLNAQKMTELIPYATFITRTELDAKTWTTQQITDLVQYVPARAVLADKATEAYKSETSVHTLTADLASVATSSGLATKASVADRALKADNGLADNQKDGVSPLFKGGKWIYVPAVLAPDNHPNTLYATDKDMNMYWRPQDDVAKDVVNEVKAAVEATRKDLDAAKKTQGQFQAVFWWYFGGIGVINIAAWIVFWIKSGRKQA